MRALLLLSGGIDSPVAARVLQAQGFDLEAVHFSYTPYTDDAPEHKSAAAAAILGLSDLTVVDAGPVFAQIPQRASHAHYFVLAKRFMVRVASRLADQRGIPFLATGENLGQVSSQTLPHLAAIDGGADRPILRPLLGWDKAEIVAEARRIGTFEVSLGPEVCDVLGPASPATSATRAQIAAEEAKLDVEDAVRAALGAVRRRPPGRPVAA